MYQYYTANEITLLFWVEAVVAELFVIMSLVKKGVLELSGELIPYLFIWKIVRFVIDLTKSKLFYTIREFAIVSNIPFTLCFKSSNVIWFDIELKLFTISFALPIDRPFKNMI